MAARAPRDKDRPVRLAARGIAVNSAYLEHAFSSRQGEWCVSIAGSRAAENWELRV